MRWHSETTACAKCCIKNVNRGTAVSFGFGYISKRNVKSVIARRKIVCTQPSDFEIIGITFPCFVWTLCNNYNCNVRGIFASALSVVSFFGKYRILVRSPSTQYHRREGIGDNSRDAFSYDSFLAFHPFLFSIEAENRERVNHMHNTNAGEKRAFLSFFFF